MEPLCPVHNQVGEGPVWSVAEQALYWVDIEARRVHCFTPYGRLDRSISVPVAKPSMCAFGGSGLDHLFITSISPTAPIEGDDATLAGAVFVTRPGIWGIAETCFNP